MRGVQASVRKSVALRLPLAILEAPRVIAPRIVPIVLATDDFLVTLGRVRGLELAAKANRSHAGGAVVAPRDQLDVVFASQAFVGVGLAVALVPVVVCVGLAVLVDPPRDGISTA